MTTKIVLKFSWFSLQINDKLFFYISAMNMSAVRLLNRLWKSKIYPGQSPRFLAFLGRHCNSENEKVSEGSERIAIELENVI